MTNTPNKVFINYTSSISCAGNNNEELFKNICDGNTGIKKNKNYFHTGDPSIGKIDSTKDFYQNLLNQCQNILEQSNLDNYESTLLIIGSSVGGMSNTEESFFKNSNYKDINVEEHNIDTLNLFLRTKYKFYDDVAFSTACTSSANAIGYAHEVLSKGIYQNVLVLGIDSLCKTTVGGFMSLGVLSDDCSKPFDSTRTGMNVSEAIACLLLQTTQTNNSIEVCGVGYSSDAYHMTQPHPDGSKNAMLNALKSANLTPNDINYINAHGTGTMANDTSEANSIFEVFKDNTPVSSTKSITGHTLGAAGALEAIISCQVLKHQMVPKNCFLEDPENKNVNFSFETKKANVNYVLSNSFAFGGNNTSLIFGNIS